MVEPMSFLGAPASGRCDSAPRGSDVNARRQAKSPMSMATLVGCLAGARVCTRLKCGLFAS
jgi:hypothetical protein